MRARESVSASPAQSTSFRETIVESRYSLRAYVARKQRDARDGHDGEAPKLARRAITITIHYLVSQSPGHNEHPDL